MKYIPSDTGREIPKGKFKCPKCKGFGAHVDRYLSGFDFLGCTLCDDKGYLNEETVLMDNGEYLKVKNIEYSDILLTYDKVRGTFADLMGYEWHRAPTRDTTLYQHLNNDKTT